MRTEYPYIYFKIFEHLPKTDVWSINNRKSHAIIGYVRWYSAWRQYCFFTVVGMVFNDGCLRDVIDFMGRLNASKKSRAVDNGQITAASQNGGV